MPVIGETYNIKISGNVRGHFYTHIFTGLNVGVVSLKFLCMNYIRTQSFRKFLFIFSSKLQKAVMIYAFFVVFMGD